MLAPNTTTELLRIGQGIAVRKGVPKPEISTAEALKQTLVKAKSVAFVPTGQTGIATLQVFEKLGIAEEMKAKTKAVKAEEIVPAVASGEAELAIFLNHYLVEAEGIDYAGPYPGDLQSYIAFSVGLGRKVEQRRSRHRVHNLPQRASRRAGHAEARYGSGVSRNPNPAGTPRWRTSL